MTDKITIKERAAVDAGIKDYGTQKEAVTGIGNDLKAELDALTAALGLEVDGETAEGEVPTGLGDSAKTRADSAADALGTLADRWQSWLDGVEVIQEEGGTAVQQADGGTSKPADPKPSTPTPQATPYSTSGGTTGGVSPYPATK